MSNLPSASLFTFLLLCAFCQPITLLCVVPSGLHGSLQDLEEELELDRKRVSEAEGVVKRAEEELTVAKERLLLQEDELQSRAGSPTVCLSQNVSACSPVFLTDC